MPIDATKGLSAVRPPIAAPLGTLLFISARRGASGFSSKPLMWPSASKRRMPMAVASPGVTGWAAIVMSAWLSMCASISSEKSMR